MKYIMVIKRNPQYTPDIETVQKECWGQVTQFLRHNLDKQVICVEVYKYTSDSRLLRHKSVTMSNMCDVCLSLTDKVLI